jgi:hypothetical protein
MDKFNAIDVTVEFSKELSDLVNRYHEKYDELCMEDKSALGEKLGAALILEAGKNVLFANYVGGYGFITPEEFGDGCIDIFKIVKRSLMANSDKL